ncbi:MAG: GMC family oxidoreductase [Alphaproteobacteria bacterium]|nr:GMC family oxidoreductase [Alphaproteobacteria bacterium]
MDGDVAAVTFDLDDDSVVVIVGSGAGGGTLANELCRKGIGVVLLEAGPRIEINEFVNDEYLMGARLAWQDRRRATGNRASVRAFPDSPAWLCKAVGGSTVHWTGTCPRIKDFEFRARTTYGAIPGTTLMDWPISLSDLAPYYDRAEDKLGVTGTHGIPFFPGNNNYKVFARGARRLGYRHVFTGHYAINPVPRDGRNACDQIGFCVQGCKSGAKWSTLYTEIPRAEATGRCEVRPRCMALQILCDKAGRVNGVLYADREGRHQVQKARAVCVAGNSIETPRLLLNSASAQHPDGLANSSGEVGRNYMTHTEGGVFASFDRPVGWHRGRQAAGAVWDESFFKPERGFAGGYYMLVFHMGLYGLAASLLPTGWGRDYAEVLERYGHMAGCSMVGEDMPTATNAVTLHPTERDQYGLPIPVVHQDDHANDHLMRNHYFKHAAALYEAAGARRITEWRAYPTGHNLGSCRMSANPRDGVVNPWGQSHDIANLFVSDGSQFTTSAAANPTLTIVALAIRQAEYIAGRMQRNDF